MEALLDALQRPHMAFKVLHVAGTNGKGTTCAMLSSMLCAQDREGAGGGGAEGEPLRVGLASSPHLCCATERIRLQGEPISEERFVALEEEVDLAARPFSDAPTFFERLVAMAFLAFAQDAVDYAVVEVGLGGRLDATNVVAPIGCAITPVGLDHQMFLGDDLASIATEKAGILKPGVPAVAASMPTEARTAIERQAQKIGAPLVWVADQISVRTRQTTEQTTTLTQSGRVIADAFRLPLAGAHQIENAILAVGLLERLGIGTAQSRQQGLNKVRWPGRFEWIESEGANMILDGAHNPAAAEVLARALREDARTSGRPLFLVMGATRGHNATQFAAALGAPSTATLGRAWAVKARAPRSVDASEVAAGLGAAGWQVVEASVLAALAGAAREAKENGGVVLVTGSLYLVGEVRAALLQVPIDPELPSF